MQVKELRELIADMPGEMPVYIPDGPGLISVKHIFRGNLVGVDQFCEMLFFGMNNHEHTPDFHDSLIERETGFKDRKALIAAYRNLKAVQDGTAKQWLCLGGHRWAGRADGDTCCPECGRRPSTEAPKD